VKAVLDTNVLVSAVLTPYGPPWAVVTAWMAGDFEVIASSALLAEAIDVLSRPRIQRLIGAGHSLREEVLVALQVRTTSVNPTQVYHAVPDDPDDNRVLEAAVAGHVDYIVTGDSDLLSLRQFEGIQIATPTEFLALREAP
jgi:uncharacterized protein